MYACEQCHNSQRAGYQELVGGYVPLKNGKYHRGICHANKKF